MGERRTIKGRNGGAMGEKKIVIFFHSGGRVKKDGE
jgi:hypothetical protein